MDAPSENRRKPALMARLYATTALACCASRRCGRYSGALAQDVGELAERMGRETPSDSQMLLEADTLVYDIDADMVSAVGAVRIEYGGNKLVAQKVSYNRKTSRLVATGGVQIIDSSGTKVFSDEIDITDDFSDGFANALRVETIDKTYFAAESAERKDGLVTTFNNGVYTACAPCEEQPDRAPPWRIKARKIIWNGKTKTVRFEESRFEFFGFPIASLPAFEIADPTIKRKSGFLFPRISRDSDLGYGLSVPYYFALSPTYDLTVTGTGLTEQGFLGEAEWRQRFNNGQYTPEDGRHLSGRSGRDSTTTQSTPDRMAIRTASAAWSERRANSTSIHAGSLVGTFSCRATRISRALMTSKDTRSSFIAPRFT